MSAGDDDGGEMGSVDFKRLRVRWHTSTIGDSNIPRTYVPDPDVLHPAVQQGGSCGSCWAIAVSQMFFDRVGKHLRAYTHINVPVPVSVDTSSVLNDAKSCVVYCRDGACIKGCSRGCNGGFMYVAAQFLTVVGVSMRLRDTGGSQFDMRWFAAPPVRVTPYDTYAQVAGANVIKSMTMSAEQTAQCAHNMQVEILTHGSIACNMNVYSDLTTWWSSGRPAEGHVYYVGWQSYDPWHRAPASVLTGDPSWSAAAPGPGGITYSNAHSVCVVGWGTDPTYGDYWVVRNSWGRQGSVYTNDGRQYPGFFRLLRGHNVSSIESYAVGSDPDAAKTLKSVTPAGAGGRLLLLSDSTAAGSGTGELPAVLEHMADVLGSQQTDDAVGASSIGIYLASTAIVVLCVLCVVVVVYHKRQ